MFNSGGGETMSVISAEGGEHAKEMYLEGLVLPLLLPTEALEFAASQDGLAVLRLEVDLLLYDLSLFLLQSLQSLLHAAALLQLNSTQTRLLTANSRSIS